MIDEKDVSIAFSPSGDVVTWQISKDARATIYYCTYPNSVPTYEFVQGRAYIPGSTMSSYKNAWPTIILPPRHKYYYAALNNFYWTTYAQHPTADCGDRCPVCTQREINRQITLYLLCILRVPRILFIPHFR